MNNSTTLAPSNTGKPCAAGRFLVADIGGTNTRIALTENGRVVRASIRRFRNADAATFEDLLRPYFDDIGRPVIDAACVAIAGPMLGDVVEVTNLGWRVDAHLVGRIIGLKKVSLLNDLEALGYCLDDLPDAGQNVIFPGSGEKRPASPRLVVGLGTGFNTAIVHKNARGDLSVDASESGHIEMPVRNENDLRLARFAGHQQGYCSIEDILSGRGLEAVYAWVAHEAKNDRTLNGAEITTAIAQGNDPLATRAMATYTTILGRVLSDFTLAYLPFGGIFLAGGVARHLAPHFERFNLAQAYTNKGRKSKLMQDFSMVLIDDDFAALTGCSIYLQQTTQARQI